MKHINNIVAGLLEIVRDVRGEDGATAYSPVAKLGGTLALGGALAGGGAMVSASAKSSQATLDTQGAAISNAAAPIAGGARVEKVKVANPYGK